MLDDVHYTYAGQSAPALSGISLSLQPGQTLGLVGPTGSGKSTLLRVLLRQATPQRGTVCWGGHALSDYTLATLRAAMSWVPQESFLFSATIAENIALARPGASRAEIEHAADMAAIHDDILRFPQSYDTPVGERGITLSGGQRQRVWLAMALAQQTDLLLLDEPTTFLDIAHQFEVMDLCARLHEEGRTLVAVLHDLNQAARYATHLVAMKAGRVVAEGTPAEVVTPERIAEIFDLACRVVEDPETGTPMVIPARRPVR